MLLATAGLLAIGLAFLAVVVLRVRRRVRSLNAVVTAIHEEGVAAMTLLRAQRAETAALLAPWRRLLRWARHPLVIAAFEWHRRRRRARRSPG